MVIAASVILCGSAIGLRAQQTATYTPSDEIFANPQRGLQKYSITNASYHTTAGYSNLNATTLAGWRTGAERVSVLFRYFLLDAYIDSAISDRYLANIRLDFARIRTAGLSCLVRFSYSNAESTAPQQPPLSRILEHIAQLAPVLEENKDIILAHQAGFLGTWGEWYYTNSTEFGTDGTVNAAQWQNRKAILDAMLAATPLPIPLQVRYPEIKQRLYGTQALTSQTAYGTTPNARIGFFNDAFLNSWGDMGTYDVSSQFQNPVGTADYTYLANETRYTPMTGETNGINAPRTDGANAVFELDSANWTTLNRDYYVQNFTNWITSGHYDAILRGLGYRFVLLSSTFTLTGNSLRADISLNNAGFARLFLPRTARLVLRHTVSGDTSLFSFDTDPRTWERAVSFSQTFDCSALPDGDYDCYLWLADPDAALASRPEYAIRFANQGLWDAASGRNNLEQRVTRSGASIRSPSAPRLSIAQPSSTVSSVLLRTCDRTRTTEAQALLYNGRSAPGLLAPGCYLLRLGRLGVGP